MTVNTLQLNEFNSKNPSVRYFINLKDETYIFTVIWNNYCDCAFLSIYDYNNNPIISSRALTNNLTIRSNLLPYTLYFIHVNGENYEPTLDIISSEYAFVYDDEEEL